MSISSYHMRSMMRGCIIGLFSFCLLLIPASSTYIEPISQVISQETIPVFLPPAPDIPQNISGIQAPDVNAAGVYIMDIASGNTLYEKSSKDIFFPASTTKMMTALVGRDLFDLDDVLTVKRVVSEGRVMDLYAGEKLSFESLLYAILVHSANDAAVAIAENDPKGMTGFMEKMNKKAKELHLEDTHFVNPVGFDDPSHVSTPRDLGVLALVLLSDPVLAKIVGTRAITVSDVTYTTFHPLKNVNDLLGKIPGMSGVKTGYTDIAGGILISQVKRDQRSVLFVVIKSEDRFADTEALVDWVFSHHRWYPASEIIPDAL